MNNGYNENNCFVFIRLPFNPENIFGYICSVTVQFIVLRYNFILTSSLVTLGIESFLYGRSMAEDMNSDFESFNMDASLKGDRLTAYKRLTYCIQSHTTYRQLSNSAYSNQFKCFKVSNLSFSFRLFDDFSSLFQPLFIVTFTWSLVS